MKLHTGRDHSWVRVMKEKNTSVGPSETGTVLQKTCSNLPDGNEQSRTGSREHDTLEVMHPYWRPEPRKEYVTALQIRKAWNVLVVIIICMG
jgi:alpha-tubulin suppressor-like RCC1 family protein